MVRGDQQFKMPRRRRGGEFGYQEALAGPGQGVEPRQMPVNWVEYQESGDMEIANVSLSKNSVEKRRWQLEGKSRSSENI